MQLHKQPSAAGRAGSNKARGPRPAQSVFGGLFGGVQQQQTAKAEPAPPPKPRLAPFPASYEQATRQAQEAVKAALADGVQLLEVEFPSASLSAVQGDGEGQNEMTWSMGFLRQFMGAWKDKQATTRVIFPDKKEAQIARFGQSMDPNAGRWATEATFGDVDFKMGYLTEQNAMWAMTGLNLFKGTWSPSDLIADSDELLVVAYPHFNPREELTALYKIYTEKARDRNLPIVIFHGELDRIRGGYYPSLFFGELDKLGKEFIPKVTPVYYIHNFKGTRPAALFRCYPGPWQVLRRNPVDPDDMRLVWQGEEQPTLKQVALEILPNNGRAISSE